MGKLPHSTNENLTKSQSKYKSNPAIIKPSSSSSIRQKENSRVANKRRASVVTEKEKENTINLTRSSSDISDDEQTTRRTNVQKAPRKVSAVHDYASKLSPNEYQCKLCSKIVRCAVDTNSNIRRHLALRHGKMHLASKSHHTQRCRVSGEKKRLFDNAAFDCIISDSRSWGDFKRPGMMKFLSIVVPGYTGPSSRTVQRKLSKLYFEKQNDFKNELAEVSNLSITVDLWRSKRCHHYFCMTGHWLDSNFNLKGKVLSFRQFKGRHLSHRLRVHMKRILTDYNLMEKIVASTTDNGSNVKAAANEFRSFGVRFHCMAHALNLSIHKGLHLWPKKKSSIEEGGNLIKSTESKESSEDDTSDDDVTTDRNEESSGSTSEGGEEDEDDQLEQDDDSSVSSSTNDDDSIDDSLSSSMMNDITTVMEKCRTTVVTIRKSSILSEFVHTLATDQLIKAGVIIDMRVRWNSTYKMLERILLYQPVLENLYKQLQFLDGVTDRQQKKLFNSRLTQDDWDLIKALSCVLDRFDGATKVLSGQNYPTLSLSYAIVISLAYYLNDRSVDPLENEIKDLLLSSYNQYMIRDGKQMEFIKVAALLDPLTYDLLTLEDKHAAESFIIKEVKEKSRSKTSLMSTSISYTTATNAAPTSSDVTAKTPSRSSLSKGALTINNFLNKCGMESGIIVSNEKKLLTIEQELAKLSSIPKDDYQFNSFWQEYSSSLPKLAKLARKYLPICSSSVPSESAFSISNYILRKNRLALSSKNVKYTMFLKDKI